MANDKKIRNDLLLVGVLIAVLLIVGAVLLICRTEGETVVVTVDGVVYGTYPLHRDTEVDIRTGENGEQYNRLVIKDGKAYVEDANCPGGTNDKCTLHAPISYEWDSIICRPHKVVVSIESEK